MIYEKPVFRSLGDTAINLEFGDDSGIIGNFRILAFDAEVRRAPPPGLIETNPQVRSIGFVFDPRVITLDRLKAQLLEILGEVGAVKTLPSRVITIPAWYDDPWSLECAKAHGVRDNMEFIAEFNGIAREDIARIHTACDYWVTGVGFVPGAFMSYAMDPRKKIGAPLYHVPRTWTPSRILNFGGNTSTIYPFRTPGGGQLFGRTPLNIFEPAQKNAPFRDGPVLARAGDRHRYVAIGQEEYNEIRAQVEAGVYAYDIREEAFSVTDYLKWLSSMQGSSAGLVEA